MYYILDGKIAKQCRSLMELAIWMETADCRVACDEIDGIVVSTVFLGLDHNFFGNLDGNSDPLLFETMIFAGNWDGEEMRRYFTWEEAEAGHREMVAEVIKHQQTANSKTDEILSSLKLLHPKNN